MSEKLGGKVKQDLKQSTKTEKLEGEHEKDTKKA